jgi:hypothetical protein
MNCSEEKEKQKLEDIKEFDRDSVRFFGNKCKDLRERKTVEAFLKVCGLAFGDDEVISYCPEPPDVLFRNARFEVVEIQDEGRKRHKEYKERAKKSVSASRLVDHLEESWQNSAPIKFSELLVLIEKEVDKKYNKYMNRKDGMIDFGALDILVYVNLLNRHLRANAKVKCTLEFSSKVKRQGWRSISFIMVPSTVPSYAGVVFVAQDAPDFIKDLQGSVRTAENPDVFDD